MMPGFKSRLNQVGTQKDITYIDRKIQLRQIEIYNLDRQKDTTQLDRKIQLRQINRDLVNRL